MAMDWTPPRVLFLSPPCEDYMADSLLHGLRTLLGPGVVDHPKHEIVYSSYPPEKRARLYGRGFTLYGKLDDVPVERDRALERAVEGEFDLVVFSDIWRGFGLFTSLAHQLPARTRVAVVDGTDRAEIYPYAGEWWRVPSWWFLPRAHVRYPYFKREITADTAFFRWYLVVPRLLAGLLPVPKNVRPIAFSIPEELVVAEPPPKRKDLASHVVDPEVARRLPAGTTSYAFATEDEYYEDLRRSRYGITTKRAGWDAMRHYEIAANGCVPCFRGLDDKPRLCPPYGLHRGNSVSYRDYDDLMGKLAAIGEERYAELQQGALRWARENSTRARAAAFLGELGFPVPASYLTSVTATSEAGNSLERNVAS
jgi:hypothetical protein